MDKLLFIKKKLLGEWDPIGIGYFFKNIKDNDNEYDKYIVKILNLLNKNLSEKRIFDYFWSIETKYMGLPGNKEKTQKFVHNLIKDFKKL